MKSQGIPSLKTIRLSLFRRRRAPPGSAPGTLVIDRQSPKPVMRVFDYNAEHFHEKTLQNPFEVLPYLTDGIASNTWIDVHGLGDEATLREIGSVFRIHPLALEDVVHVGQRPKVERYDEHWLIVTRLAEIGAQKQVETEQLSLILGPNFLLTFQEFPGDPFDPVRDRLRRNKGRLRKMGPDFLMYTLIDAVLDNYFPLIEQFGEIIEELESQVVLTPRANTLQRIHQVKADLLTIRRSVWPQREMFNHLIRDETPLIVHETQIHLRDCYDHTVQLMDMVETYRELVSGLIDVYLSSIANRTNEVMKVLTIVSTIFIPLTFIAGVYGMNFHTEVSAWNMPELRWYYGYPIVMGGMFLIALSMFYYFWKLGWIGSTHSGEETEEEEEDVPVASGPPPTISPPLVSTAPSGPVAVKAQKATPPPTLATAASVLDEPPPETPGSE